MTLSHDDDLQITEPDAAAEESDVRARLLGTAERLFAERGFAETPVRSIVGEAGVNIASVNYYFGSKEGLLKGIVARRLIPLNSECIRLLDEAETDGHATIEALLSAMVGPSIRLGFEHPHFAKLASRLRIDADSSAWREYRALRKTTLDRFRAAFHVCLPYLAEDEVAERVHYILGGILHVWAHAPMKPDRTPEAMLRSFVTFYAAALRAPAPEGL